MWAHRRSERLWRGQRFGVLGRVPHLTGGGEGMGGGGAFGDDLGGGGLPADGARDRLLDRAIVEVLIFLSSLASQWMNTPTQMKRSSASSAGITPSATLSATALATAYCAGPNICTACLSILDRDFGNHDRRRLGQEVRGQHGEQRSEPVLVVGQAMDPEGRFGRTAARSNEQIDMRDFVAVANQRLSDT